MPAYVTLALATLVLALKTSRMAIAEAWLIYTTLTYPTDHAKIAILISGKGWEGATSHARCPEKLTTSLNWEDEQEIK